MTQVLVLADDLTGALEVGAKFAGEGIPSVVTTDASLQASEPVLVIDTQSRHLRADAAAEKIRQVLGEAHTGGLRLIFKKTDSTLRGNIAAELQALSDFCNARVVYVPAYPAMGRTVRDGRLYVNGVPVDCTSFARDSLNPISDSWITVGPCCDVVDGETDADVELAARSLLQGAAPLLAAGTGALAGALAAMIEMDRQERPTLPRVRRCLVVNGSLHEASALQVAQISGERWPVLQTEPMAGRAPLQIADETGVRVRDALRSGSFDAVLVCGGDTTYGMLKAVGFPPIRPLREVVTGVPISKIVVDGRELYLITKAGGFGDMDILEEAGKILHG